MDKSLHHLKVEEFPLKERTAQRILNELASNESGKIKFSTHAKERMQLRDVTMVQVMTLLKSEHLYFQESPHQAPNGDWKANIEGYVIGERIRVTLAFKKLETDPSVIIITVMNLQ